MISLEDRSDPCVGSYCKISSLDLCELRDGEGVRDPSLYVIHVSGATRFSDCAEDVVEGTGEVACSAPAVCGRKDTEAGIASFSGAEETLNTSLSSFTVSKGERFKGGSCGVELVFGNGSFVVAGLVKGCFRLNLLPNLFAFELAFEKTSETNSRCVRDVMVANKSQRYGTA